MGERTGQASRWAEAKRDESLFSSEAVELGDNTEPISEPDGDSIQEGIPTMLRGSAGRRAESNNNRLRSPSTLLQSQILR